MDRRPRKLIACLDGTWNQRDSEDSPTNVAKMARAIAPTDADGGSQLIYYHPGVGSGDWFDRIVGGGFGAGLSANVESAYSFLADNFRENDLIYLFGFSRGAFSARSLAGLVTQVGILSKSNMVYFQSIFDIYRSQKHRNMILNRDVDKSTRLNALQALFPKDSDKVDALEDILENRRNTKIFFVGVWDTVGSLGVPYGPLRWVTMRRYGFHNTDLNEDVRYAYQALAIDERRGPFNPTLWTRKKRNGDAPSQTLRQVWFAGCHSNVGGGYAESGLSDMSFLWMAAQAQAAVADENHQNHTPLAFDPTYFNRENIDPKPGTLVNSRTGIWFFLPWRVRQLMAPPKKEGFETCERIHRSVIMRYHASFVEPFEPKRYRPRNAKQYVASEKKDLIEELTEFETQHCSSYAPQGPT